MKIKKNELVIMFKDRITKITIDGVDIHHIADTIDAAIVEFWGERVAWKKKIAADYEAFKIEDSAGGKRVGCEAIRKALGEEE